MRGLVRFSVDHPVTITMLVGILVVMGMLSLSRMGQDLMPDISFPTVTVVTQYEGASPEEVEKLVTQPVEGACALISGVQKVSSTSAEGVSTVTLEFEWGTDIDVASQDVREKLGMIEKYLPEEAERPAVYKFDPSMMPAIEYALYSDKFTQTQLKKLSEDLIKPRLERQEGVASVLILGVEDEEIIIDVDMAKLHELGLSLGELINVLRGQNLNLPAGHYMIGPREYLIRAVGEVSEPQELLDVPVGFTKDGRPVRLSEVARVWTGLREKRGYYEIEGKPGVLLIVQKQSGSNTVQVADRVKREMGAIKPLLPQGIETAIVMDFSEAVKANNKNTFDTAWQGMLLAALIVFLFLFNWRPTLVISLAIPLSVFATFIVLHLRGDTLNMMTLGGITLAVGMLVDNAVVVIENMFRHAEMGKPSSQAAVDGASEVGLAITASTLTNIVVFLPLIYSGGIVGEIMRSLAFTVTVTMLMSLVVAITIIPSYAAKLFRAEKKSRLAGWFNPVSRVYRFLLELTLRHRVTATIVTLLLMAGSAFVFLRLGGEFIPMLDMRFIPIEVELPPGTPADATKAYLEHGADIAREYSEVEMISVMVGSGGFMSSFGRTADVNQGTLFLKMKPPEQRRRYTTEVAHEIIARMPPYYGSKAVVSNYQSQMLGGGMPIEIHIYGPDVNVLTQLGEDVLNRIKNIPGIVSPDVSVELAKPEIKVTVDKERAAYYGLTAYQIVSEIEALTLGKVASRMEVEGDQLNIVVRADSLDRASLSNAWIKSPTGALVPLSEVSTVILGTGPTRIDRENQVRFIRVTADKEGRSLQEVSRDVSKALSDFKTPPGYTWEIAGESKRMSDMMRQMFWVILAAVVLTYMIMAALFESFKRPLIVMFTVPLAFIGSAFALWFSGMTLSMVSLMGLLIVFGVVVNNAIVMIDLIDKLRERGTDPYEAVVDGAVLRLRPILITALTTIFGLAPMAFIRTRGWEMRSPIAIALIGGLMTGTFVTLLVIPMVYTWFEGIRTKRRPKEQG
ncbi:MAG: efflux RND transporter permease subunit [candidate division WOR-3 bacterium]